LKSASCEDCHSALVAARMYWSFVVAIWPLLYVMVYLW
jgi:heme/copper-type cytochrome/quinol oxidase subunit 3